MTCKHDHIQTYKLEDGTPVMWACVECKLKFEPCRKDLCDNCQKDGKCMKRQALCYAISEGPGAVLRQRKS